MSRWTPPTLHRLFAAIDATWPARSITSFGNWTLREGAGGGQRVSAATLDGQQFHPHDITAATDTMRKMGQRPLFMLRTGAADQDATLDRALADAGFVVKDPVNLFACSASRLAQMHEPGLRAIPCAAPLARQIEIWADGGIGPGRIAVMQRAKGPKTFMLARNADRPVGTAFVALDGSLAMLHALEIAPAHRRKGAARSLSVGAAYWAARAGAETFAVVATAENRAATALYQGLGMAQMGQYHYRVLPETAA